MIKNNFSLKIDKDVLVYSGCNIETGLHAHFLVSIVISKNNKFKIESDRAKLESNFCIVPANYPHEFESVNNDEIVFIFLEPEGIYSRLIKNRFSLTNSIINLEDDRCLNLKKGMFFESDRSIPNIRSFVDTMIETKTSFDIDDRILTVCYWIEGNLDKKIEVSKIARTIPLSSSRLRGLFKQEIGMSISKYIRWKRLRLAGQQLVQGTNFTEAMYYAGFYDAAHFNRAFKEMFGINPFQVLK